MANKDTENKRRGGFNKALVLPAPDGTIAQSDRQHKSLKYPGILSTAPVLTYPTGSLGGTPSGGTDFVIPRVPRGLPPGATTRMRRGTQHLQNSAWNFLGANSSAEDDDLLLLRDSSNNNFKRITKADLGITGGGATPGDPGDDGTEVGIRFQYIEVNVLGPPPVAINTAWDEDAEAAFDPGKITIWVVNTSGGGSTTYQFGGNVIIDVGGATYDEFTLDASGDSIMMITTLVGNKMKWSVLVNNGATLA